MRFSGKKPVTAFLAVAALVTAFIASGCSSSNPSNVTGWTLTGKVVDANSRTGVAGARVCVKVNGDWNRFCAKSSDGATGGLTANAKPRYAAQSTTGTTVGDFAITGLPYLANPTPIIVQAPVGSTYSDTTTTVNFGGGAGLPGASAGAANGQFDLGDVFIDQGVTADIFVITNTPATPVNTNGAPIYFATNANGDVVDVPATYVDTNHYTITLPRSGTGTNGLATANWIIIPPFKSASGAYYNTATTNVKWQDVAVEAHPTINLTVTPTGMATALAVVASNFVTMTDNTPAPGIVTNTLPKDGVVKLYMNLPITLVVPTSADSTAAVPNPYVIALTYADYFKALTAAPALTTQAVTAAVDSTDRALLSITPTAALTENQTYKVTGRVQVATDWANQPGTNHNNVVNLDTIPTAATTFYVYMTGTGSIGSSPRIIVDNGNGWSGYVGGSLTATPAKLSTAESTGAATPGKPRLLFPEMVWGTVRLISYPGTLAEFIAPKTATGTITYVNNNQVTTRKGVQITGIGTSFDTQLQIGDQITDGNNVVWTIVQIDSATSIIATAANDPLTNGTSFSTVPNQGAPGTAFHITMREGYYVNGVVANVTGTGTKTLLGSQRVPSGFVNDIGSSDVLSFGAGGLPGGGAPFNVTAVTTVTASPGMGRAFVYSLGSNEKTVAVGGGSKVENGGSGYSLYANAAVVATAGGALSGPLSRGATTVAGVLDALVINGAFASDHAGTGAAADGVYTPAVADYPYIAVDNAGGAAAYPVATAGAATAAGHGYSTNALSLAATHANGLGSGITATLTAATQVIGNNAASICAVAVGAPVAAASVNLTGGTGYKTGDILIVNPSTAPVAGNMVAVLEIMGVTAAGAPTACEILLPSSATAYTAGAAALTTTNLGSFLNNGVPSTVAGTQWTAMTLAAGINVTLVGPVAAPLANTGNLGAVNSIVSTTCPAASATANTWQSCITSLGTAGAIAGDILTVINPNVGTVTGASHGTIKVTAVDTNTGRVSAGVVTSPGANYPNIAAASTVGVTTSLAAGSALPAGVLTNFPIVTLSTAPALVYNPTIGSNTARSTFIAAQVAGTAVDQYIDIVKYGGTPLRALEDYTLATAGTNSGDIAGLTYSIEYTNACGNAQIPVNPGAVIFGHIAWLQAGDTAGSGAANNSYGYDWTGAAMLCDLTNVWMFGWTAGAGPALAPATRFDGTAPGKNGPLHTGQYIVSDSTTGTPMQIRLDINVVDAEGNKFLATDTSYDVH